MLSYVVFVLPQERKMRISHKLIKKRRNEMKLFGAVQISGVSFFVYKKHDGTLSLKSEKEEKLQKDTLKRMIMKNPKILKILEHYKIKLSIDTKMLKNLAKGHMNDTCNVAIGIYNALSENIRTDINQYTIKEASMLHDLGKVLIPAKVLNKPAKLNSKEREIMNIHATLGYELLKTQGVNSETLELIKYHHQNLKHSGYPMIENNDTIHDLGVQIISTADKYSALREARVYRKKLSKIESLLILYREVLEGKIHKDIYKALFEYASKYDKAA